MNVDDLFAGGVGNCMALRWGFDMLVGIACFRLLAVLFRGGLFKTCGFVTGWLCMLVVIVYFYGLNMVCY